jgi:hypothetical protein
LATDFPEQHPNMETAVLDHAGGKDSLAVDVCTGRLIGGELILRIARKLQVTIGRYREYEAFV